MTRTDAKRRKRNRRLITLAWIAGIATLIIVLLYKERADWLYVLATLSLTTLLVIVAVTDLGAAGRKGVDEASLGDDSASIGSGITTNASSTAAATAPSDWRRPKNRKTRRK